MTGHNRGEVAPSCVLAPALLSCCTAQNLQSQHQMQTSEPRANYTKLSILTHSTCTTLHSMLVALRDALERFWSANLSRKCTLHGYATDCQIRLRPPENDMLDQLYAVIWTRNGVGLSCMGPYRHADAIDSVRLIIRPIQRCRSSVPACLHHLC